MASFASCRRLRAETTKAAARRARSCRIWFCHNTMTCARATSRCGVSMATWLRQPIEPPVDFVELLLTPGVGARTIRALALVAEVVHGSPYRFTDPARFSLAHGGKDGHPFPVPCLRRDHSRPEIRRSKSEAWAQEELAAIKRLDEQARFLERRARGSFGRTADHRGTRTLRRLRWPNNLRNKLGRGAYFERRPRTAL